MSAQDNSRSTIIVMGVCGCGKSTFAKALSESTGGILVEGDELHNAENIAKMSRGEALNDSDRIPWLKAIRDHVNALSADKPIVVACSALTKSYRQILRQIDGQVTFAFLQGDRQLIEKRMSGRAGHFMPASLIESQFATLQVPTGENDVVTLNIELTIDQLLGEFYKRYQHGFWSDLATVHTGLIGLGVMGRNLAKNILDKQFKLAAWDLDPGLRQQYRNAHGAKSTCYDGLEQLIGALERPRCLLLLIKAGSPVDQVLEKLLVHLDPGDVVVDLGNSWFRDTGRRVKQADKVGIRYIGCGISGGADGARFGPALMPGGNARAWPVVAPLLQSLAAEFSGEPCVSWIGPQGAGHFVKMVHNGIEYADMQLIAEAYHLMSVAAAMSSDEIAEKFEDWNRTELGCFLIEATAKILKTKEPDGQPLVDRILDAAGQKGTGSWTSQTAFEYGVPVSMINASVTARIVSSMKNLREKTAANFVCAASGLPDNPVELIGHLEAALLCARAFSYIQGFLLLQQVSADENWQLELQTVAKGWRAGCIIRGEILNHIVESYSSDDHDFLLNAPWFAALLNQHHHSLRYVIKYAIDAGLPVAAFSAALAFFDAVRNARLPANLIQAQRDFFGAHQYERTDAPRGEMFHTDW